MPNALDMYRAQQSAAQEVQAKLTEVSALVQQVRREVDALAKNHDLRDLIRQEQTWLEQAERTVKEVQRWRDLEAYRFWPGVWVASAGQAWWNSERNEDNAALRARVEVLDQIERQVAEMTAGERRQFDRLIRLKATGSTLSQQLDR